MDHPTDLTGAFRHELKRNDVGRSRPQDLGGALVSEILPGTECRLVESHRLSFRSIVLGAKWSDLAERPFQAYAARLNSSSVVSNREP